MQSHEVPQDQWVDFCNRFSDEHLGWPVTIEVLSQEAGPERILADQPLRGISLDPAGSRPCSIDVGAGNSLSSNFTHTVDHPRHIRLADQDRNSGTLEIQPKDGPATLVHFHRPA
ncbi:MAG: DUF5335 family protein [Phycisphaerales bacterium]|jgi:hypothetical protein|nr:DUF5335 family protein [Phycisphaerales bacterium]